MNFSKYTMLKKTLTTLCFIIGLAQASEIITTPKQDQMLAQVNTESRLITFTSPSSQINMDLQLPFEQRAKFIDFFEHHKMLGEVNVDADRKIEYKGFFGSFKSNDLEQFKDTLEQEREKLKDKLIKLDSYYFAMASKNTMQELYDKKMYDQASLIEIASKLKLPNNGIILVYPYKNDFVFYAVK